MRIVFIGAGREVLATATELLKQKHEVIIIEKDKDKIDTVSDSIDCGFLNGDGSTPAVLQEAGPGHTDFLFCMTESDQMNIIAGLVGRSLGFAKVVTKIEDRELTHICKELGLENTIIPTVTISRYLNDMIEGRGIQELSSMVRGDARLFSFIIGKGEENTVQDLDFPAPVRVVCYYRDGEFQVTGESTSLKEGDEVVIVTYRKNIEAVRKKWSADRNSQSSKQQEKEKEEVEGMEDIK